MQRSSRANLGLALCFVARLGHAQTVTPIQATPETSQDSALESAPAAPAPLPGELPPAVPQPPVPTVAPAGGPPPPAARPAGAPSALVRIAADYPNAWLEARPFGSNQEWQRVCATPCGTRIAIDGIEARVSAPSMTPSAPFRIQTGSGTALLDVDGGSALARTWGRVGFAVGVPLSLVGMAGFAYGSFDDRSALRTAGVITLGVGAAIVLTALPLLVAGTTKVKNEHGDLVANADASTRF